MRKKYPYVFGVLIIVLSFTAVLICLTRGKKIEIKQYTPIDRLPGIRPDYAGTVIPPNIAPLNFLIAEDGSYYFVKIYSKQGRPIELYSRSPKIIIPEDSWHRLLDANRGQQLYLDIFVRAKNNQWNLFSTITNKIAPDNIDSYLIYRKIHPGHSTWRDMGIYQRNLYNYNESVVLDNGYLKRGCLNCHTFCNNQTDKMLIGIRSSEYGSSTLLVADEAAQKIGAKVGYTTWHPSGRMATFTISKIRQFFHTARNEVRDVVDLDSALAYYLVDSKTVKTSPDLSQKDRLETYPTWSPDGRYLYFCSAPMLWTDRNKLPPDRYKEVQYDLVRISYDIKRDQWGRLETILSAKDTGLCMLMPRISPDGRWLLFCMCDYSAFPVYQQSSDLYLIDLQAAEQSGRYEPRRLRINSDQSESWHSWSANSRWMAFSSKRDYGVFTRSYFSYVDADGKVYKPFLLPQKDPTLYDSCLRTYSVPELVIEPVKVTGEKLGRVVRGLRKIDVQIPITMASPKVGTAPAQEEPWHEHE